MSTSPYFAQDPTKPLAVSEALGKFVEDHPELHWAALVDSAFDYSSRDSLPYAQKGINCYDSKAYEGLAAAAPWLVPLRLGQEGHPQLRQLLRHCSGRPMLSFVASTVPVTELHGLWAKLHWVETPDNQRMLLRFADTRVLPSLPKALVPEQWAALAGRLQQWHYINREGSLSSCLPAERSQAAVPPLHLTQEQLNTMLQAAEPDAVIDLLTEQMYDTVPTDLKRSAFYVLISEACELGRQHGVDNFPDTVSLAVAACLSKGQSSKDPRLAALLRDKKWTNGDLGKAIVNESIV